MPHLAGNPRIQPVGHLCFPPPLCREIYGEGGGYRPVDPKRECFAPKNLDGPDIPIQKGSSCGLAEEDDHPRSDHPQLGIEPVGAVLDLSSRRLSVTASSRIRSWVSLH